MIALDVESTGTNPEEHSMLAIGAVDMDNPANQFYDECRIWDGARIEDAALAINGFTEDEAKDPSKKTEAELVAAFFAWADGVGERTLAAQNVSFDHGFLMAAAKRAGIEFPFAKRTIDLHSVAWLHMSSREALPPTKNGHSGIDSGAIQAYCGIPNEEKPHNALTGALWHAEALSRMAYTKNLLPEFSTFPIPWLTK